MIASYRLGVYIQRARAITATQSCGISVDATIDIQGNRVIYSWLSHTVACTNKITATLQYEYSGTIAGTVTIFEIIQCNAV